MNFNSYNNYNPYQMAAGSASLIGGLFGNSGAPSQSGYNEINRYAGKAEDVQNPYLQAGNEAIPQYQDWLKTMQDPAAFINNLSSQYSTSPQEQYAQQQAMRSGTNAASANGLSGSTPNEMQMQQNSANISNQYMNQWLQNVLGINTEYGHGTADLMHQGATSANALTNLYGNLANASAKYAQGSTQGNQNDKWNSIAGGAALASMF